MSDDYEFVACPHCGAEMDWEDCDQCGGEGTYDAYESDPLWYSPGDTEMCELCGGSTGFWWCPSMRCPAKAATMVPDGAPGDRSATDRED